MKNYIYIPNLCAYLFLQSPGAAQIIQRAVGREDSGVARGAQRHVKVSVSFIIKQIHLT